MIVTQELVHNSILGLQLGRGMVSLVRTVSLKRMVRYVHVLAWRDAGFMTPRVRDHVILHLGLNVSSPAHNCGCVIDGSTTMAAFGVLLLLIS